MTFQHFFENCRSFPCIRMSNVCILSVSCISAVQISRHQFPQRKLLTPLFGNSDQFSFLIYDQYRLYVHNSTDNGCCRGNASSALQIHEVLHHKDVADFVAHFLEISCIFGCAHPTLFVIDRQLGEQSHPARCGQRIDRIYFRVRVFFVHVHLRDPYTVESLCQSARQRQINHGFTAGKMLFKCINILLRSNLTRMG